MTHDARRSKHSEHSWQPKIVGFLCNWCSYAGADLAGQLRLEYPPNIKIIRVPCSSRVNPLFVLKCLMSGCDGVLVSGCHTGDCHYSEGNFYARRRFTVLRKLLEYSGIDPRRFQLAWVSASEGDKWAKLVNGLIEEIRQAGPNNLVDK